MEQDFCLLAFCILPLIGSVFAGFGKWKKGLRNVCVNGIWLAQSVILLVLGRNIFRTGEAVTLSLGEKNILRFTMEPVRFVMCLVFVLCFGIVLQFMRKSLWQEVDSDRFYAFYMLLLAVVDGAVLSDTFWQFSIFLVCSMLVAYPLICHRKGAAAVKNAGIFLKYTVVATGVIIFSMYLFWKLLKGTGFDVVHEKVTEQGLTVGIWFAAFFLFLGYAVFTGVFPLQLQMTRGNSYGLMEASAVLSQTASKLGLFGMFLLATSVFSYNRIFGECILVMAVATIIWGLLISLTATDIRKILMGLTVAVNGINVLDVFMTVRGGASNGYAIRGGLYTMLMSSLSLVTLYMVSLVLVRRKHTYEIKGLIAAGKGHYLSMLVCLLACMGLAGVPGTIGFLAYSMLYKALLTTPSCKWLVVIFVMQWAFLMTAVVRVFMKFFISKKDETIRILTTEEELQAQRKRQEQAEPEKNIDEEDGTDTNILKKPYLPGKLLLLLAGLLQVGCGLFPAATVDRLAEPIATLFHGELLSDALSYYTWDVWIAFFVVVLLCILFYVNLVHGILLRTIRNKKNQQLKESHEKKEKSE